MPNFTIGYKAFRVDKQERLRYLFHAHEGTSLVEFDVWLKAKQKLVREAQGKRYRSGFHFLRTPEHVEKFQKMTKNKYVFIPVHVRNIRPKPRTSVGSWLAQEIRIPGIEAQKVMIRRAFAGVAANVILFQLP